MAESMPWVEQLVAGVPRRQSERIDELELNANSDGYITCDESVPAGFFEELATTFRPDGYLIGAAAGRYSRGMGCGFALSLLQAFPATPKGLVLADSDLAALCGLELLVEALARHADAESFIAGFLGGGEEPLRARLEEILRNRESRGLPVPRERNRQRLWRGLRRLPFLPPAAAPRRAMEWAGLYPAPRVELPVWTYIVRGYAQLHELAGAGAIAVVQTSILDPAFHAALSRLPGFGGAANVVYLSNLADHEVRRTLMASARRKLGILDGGRNSRPSSTPEFLVPVNAELTGLRALAAASGRTVFIHTCEALGQVLTTSSEPPRYEADDFYLKIDLDRLIQGLFEAPSASGGTARTSTGELWRRATLFHRQARALFGAAMRRDREQAGTVLEWLVREVAELPLSAGDDRACTAFRLAELSEGAALARQGLAEAFPQHLGRLVEAVRAAAGPLADGIDSAPDAIPDAETFLLAHACAATGALLNDPSLGGLARRLATAALAKRPIAAPLGWRVEWLFRLLRYSLHLPSEAATSVLRREIAELFATIGPTGVLDLDMASETPEGGLLPGGYESYVLSEDTIASNLRLLLFLQGLSEESLEPLRAALVVRLGAPVAS
jgi:hypothetical protein